MPWHAERTVMQTRNTKEKFMDYTMPTDSVDTEASKQAYSAPAVTERGDFTSATNGSGNLFAESSGRRLRW